MIFYQNWYDKGVIYIQDLMNSHGKWLTYNEFCLMYDVQNNSVLHYMGVTNCLKALKKEMKIMLT